MNGIGCSATESDADMDGVWDADDLCPYTPTDVEIDSNGCADEQKDTDSDLINDAEDQCPMTLQVKALISQVARKQNLMQTMMELAML